MQGKASALVVVELARQVPQGKPCHYKNNRNQRNKKNQRNQRNQGNQRNQNGRMLILEDVTVGIKAPNFSLEDFHGN
jgi:hypothetical protein